MKSYHDRQSLAGKVVILTGGIGILGRHFARGYAEMGASVAVVDLQQSDAVEVAENISREYDVETIGIGCDITRPDAVDDMVQKVVQRFGSVHVLHNNAATKGSDVRAFFTPFEDYPLDLWREIMSVNIDGMFLVAQRVGRQLISQGAGGSIIQTGSIYGLVAPDPRIYEGSDYLGGAINTPAVYAASKAAVVGLTRYLATHWAAHNIRVNCLVPGGVESGQNAEFSRRYSDRVPMSRMAQPEEIVSAALFLAGEASSYMTGQVIAVDGGWTCW